MMSLLAVSVMAQPTARQWNSEVTAGWNLGNQLECPAPGWDNESTGFGNPAGAIQAETTWGNPVVTLQTLQAVKAAGFNAVRIPVRWQCHITDATTMTIDPQWLQRVKEVVGYALDCGMKVIINTHHDKWLESRPIYINKVENNQKLALLWTQIAHAFQDYGYEVAFAGTNEVHIPNNWNAPTEENLNVQNAYNQTFVDAVRATGGNNQKRHLMVQTYNCNVGYGLNGGLVIPTDMEGNGHDYMSVEIHYYTPWGYCGTNTYYYWGQPYKQYGPTPASNDEQELRDDFEKMVQTWSQQGLGVIIGEWGITDHWTTTGRKALIHENMAYYCKTLVSEARQRGFSTFVWDNSVFGNGDEKFGIFDRQNNMNPTADWMVQGIQEGIATGITLPTASHDRGHTSRPRKYLHQGGLYIIKDGKRYNCEGLRFEN